MEWKEHVAWIVPMLATAVLVAALYFGRELINRETVRLRTDVVHVLLRSALAAIAGLLGALITKNAPVL